MVYVRQNKTYVFPIPKETPSGSTKFPGNMAIFSLSVAVTHVATQCHWQETFVLGDGF